MASLDNPADDIVYAEDEPVEEVKPLSREELHKQLGERHAAMALEAARSAEETAKVLLAMVSPDAGLEALLKSYVDVAFGQAEVARRLVGLNAGFLREFSECIKAAAQRASQVVAHKRAQPKRLKVIRSNLQGLLRKSENRRHK